MQRNQDLSAPQNPPLQQPRALIQPMVGWLICAFVIYISLDQMGLALGNFRPVFWGLGLLIAGSIYAINELALMKTQLTGQHLDLQNALCKAHENAVERDMAEDALQESQLRYYHLAEATFEAICIHDRGTILDLNQNFAELFGYRVEELTGKNIDMFCAEEVRDGIRLRMDDNSADSYESTGLLRSGERIPIGVNVKKIPYNGREVRVVAIRDLRLVKAQEAEREESRRKILSSEGSRRAILESSVDGILVFGQDDMILDANPASEQAFGFQRHEFIGRSVADTVIAPSHRASYLKMLEEAIAKGRGFLGRRVKVRAMRRDGSEFDSEVTTTAIQNTNSVDFVASVRDISERMEQQHRVESLLARMRALVENLQAGVLVLDDEQNVVTANQSFCDMFRFPQGPDKILKQKRHDLIPQFKGMVADGEAYCERADQAMAALAPTQPEEFRTVDGRVLERQYIPAVNGGVFQGHLWIYRDISQRKSAEAELEAARDAALDSARFKSQFLANMSHEIRTPMNAIVGMTELLLETPLDAEQKDFASTVKQASDSLLTLINQILDFSKIEAGKLTLENADFDLRQLGEGVAGMFAARAQAKGLKLGVDIAPGLPTLLRGDSGRLGQVLINLMGNALKFTDGGEIILKMEGDCLGADRVELKMEVRDSGIGIAPEALAHLFQPFVQADGSITRRFGGTGLGLAISKDLVELMGGEIAVKSSVHTPQGTCFSVKLNLERQSSQATARQEFRKAEPACQRLCSGRVLIAEDNPVNQRVIRMQMAKLDQPVDMVGNGREALAALETGNYGMVLMDCQMPLLDGLAATADWRRREAAAGKGLRIPIVAMTANALEGDRERCLEAGMDGYLSKPVKMEELERALARWMPEAQGARAAHESLPIFSSDVLKSGLGEALLENGVFLEMVQIFSSDTPARLARLERAAKGRDSAGMMAEAHAIKGSCGALGALRMGASCEALETMGRNARHEGAEALVKALKVEFQFTLEELAHAAGPAKAAA